MRKFALCFLMAFTLYADELDILDSFENIEISANDDAQKSSDVFRAYQGAITLQDAYNVEKKREFKTARIKGDLEFRKRFNNNWRVLLSGSGYYDAIYSLNSRDKYSSETLKNMEDEIELKETYIHGSLTPSIDVKLGRQIVTWGKSDNLRVTDMLNPLDSREPGMIDIENLRLPVAMAKVDYYLGKWDLSLIAIGETRFSKTPPFGSDFYPFGEMKINDVGKPKKAQFAAALNAAFEGWDIAFYGANLYRDEFRLHERFNMAGTAGAFAIDNWLFKAEAAYLYSLKSANKNYSRFDALIGAEYNGVNDATFSLEALTKKADDKAIETEYAYAARATYKLLNERANINLLILRYGKTANDGSISRFWGEYDITDSLKIKIGETIYKGSKAPYNNFKNNDRIFVELKLTF
jgi:hypothetical protein